MGHFCPPGFGSGSTGSGSATLWETRLKGRFSTNHLAWKVILIWRPCRYGRNNGLKLFFFSLRIRIRIATGSRIRIKVKKPDQDPDLHLSPRPATDHHKSKNKELLRRLAMEPWRLTLRPRRLTMDLTPHQGKSQIRIRIKVKSRIRNTSRKEQNRVPGTVPPWKSNF